jgi:hypothetical protein
MDAAPPWLGYYVFVANLVEIVLLVGVWYRQRWGVYGLIGGTILSIAIDRLIPVSPLNDVVSLLELGLLICLVHEDWDYFQPPPLIEYRIGVRPLIGLVAIGVMLYGASFVLVKPGGWAGAAATPTPLQSALPPTPLPTITPFPLRSGPIAGCAEPTTPIASNTVLCVGVTKPAVSSPSPPLLMSDADTHFETFGRPLEQLELRVWGDALWDLTFATEPNTLFHLGQYLAPWPSKAGRMAQPGVRLAGTITDCSNGLGRFTVLDLDYDFASQQVQRFAANFEVYCDVDVVNGAVRFHSDVPLSAVDPPIPSPTPLLTPVPLGTGPLVVPACQADATLQGQPTYLCLESAPGDVIGGGKPWRIIPAPAETDFIPQLGAENRRGFAIDLQNQALWQLDFSSGPTGLLTPGLYIDPDPGANSDGDQPSLQVRHSLGCQSWTGRFEVLENRGLDQDTLHFTVNFEQHCDGGPPLLGVLRYQSTVPP